KAATDEKTAKDDKKATDEKEVKEDKTADLSKEEFAAKAKDLTDTQAITAVKDAYKKELAVLSAYDPSAAVVVPDCYTAKDDYATKEKVQTYLEKEFSASYLEKLLTTSEKFKVVDGKCYIKRVNGAVKFDFTGATVKTKEVKDNQVNVTLKVVNDDETTTFKAVLVYEDATWKLDALTYAMQSGLNGNVLA
ncbi:MAG: DL-endopeptidase inhibitor IseA family protein, partial [Clostridium sp.]|nr:DL-endopeptidase inhibitor IseA family protein [Clostridium sp.]